MLPPGYLPDISDFEHFTGNWCGEEDGTKIFLTPWVDSCLRDFEAFYGGFVKQANDCVEF